jgi:hypothetical protein
MISKFIRAQWASHELECIDNERRQLLEEAAELDSIWGAWETGAELTSDPREWLKQPSLSRDDLRYHCESAVLNHRAINATNTVRNDN